jgi:tetratricopeptide (TPR) repeat protein
MASLKAWYFRNPDLARETSAAAVSSLLLMLLPDAAPASPSRSYAYLASANNAKSAAERCENESYDVAIQACSEVIRNDRRAAWAYNNRGLELRKKHVLEKAISDFSEAIRLKPDFAEAYYNRGRTQGADTSDAIVDCDEAIKINPKYAEAYNSRGDAWEKRGEVNRAIADYQKAIRVNPNFELAKLNLKTLLSAQAREQTNVAAQPAPQRQAAFPQVVSASMSCQSYADFAVQQFRSKSLLQCDGGQQEWWRDDYRYHYDWCASLPANSALPIKGIADREKVLAKCEAIDTAQRDPLPPETASPPQVAQSQAVPSAPAQTSPAAAVAGWTKHDVTIPLKSHPDEPAKGTLGIRTGPRSEDLIGVLKPGQTGGVFVMGHSVDRLLQMMMTLSRESWDIVDSPSMGLLQRGDIITVAAGRAVSGDSDLLSVVRASTPGTPMKLEVWRYRDGLQQLESALWQRAQSNDAGATFVLGVFEQIPAQGVPNYERAFAFFHRAAALGHLRAMEFAAFAYRTGRGADKNPAEAEKWYRRSAERGSADGMFNLALLMSEGQPGQATQAEAFRLMERAASRGLLVAYYQLAKYSDIGHGTARNPAAGAQHLFDAVRKGSVASLTGFPRDSTGWKPSTEFVAALQRLLRDASVYHGPLDGTLGPEVIAGLTRLQKGGTP